MQLPAPARECTDAEIDAMIGYWDLRRQPQPLPPLDYAAHTAECAPDDDGPAGDLRSMAGFVAALIWAVVVVIAAALAVVLL